MNETVKAIWNKAASSHVQAETSWKTKENFISRFAELIAEECARLADEPTSRPFVSYGEKIKNHFGLEK